LGQTEFRRRGGDRHRCERTVGNPWGGITGSTPAGGIYAQVRPGAGPKGGNSNQKEEAELSLAPGLVDEIPLEGKIITGDALFAQKHLCRTILSRKGNYLFIVKGNQEWLYFAIKLLFEKPDKTFHFEKAEQWSRHGNRLEVRHLWSSTMLNDYLKWPGLKQVLKIERQTETKGQRESQLRYAITSLGSQYGARRLLDLFVGIGIENQLFRGRHLGEDASQVRKDLFSVDGGFMGVVIGLLYGYGQHIAAIKKWLAISSNIIESF
jgi:predicted transposase YbfD/YdcC